MNILCRNYLTTITVILLLTYFLLSSCNSSPREFPEGNIDVDSEIYIVPVGDVNEKYLYALIPKLEKRFTTKAHLALDKRLPDPDHAYDSRAKQHVAMYVLRDLVELDVPDNVKVLGVANVDLFVPESDRSFVFGQAQFGRNSKAALISMLRMNPSSYVRGKPDDELLVRRMTIEAIHELGHVFGLSNCGEPECVMYLPKNLKELDKKSDSFCLRCQKASRVFNQPGTPGAESGS